MGIEEIADYRIDIRRDELLVKRDFWAVLQLAESPISVAVIVDHTVGVRDCFGYFSDWVSRPKVVYYEPAVELVYRNIQPKDLMMGPELFASLLDDDEFDWLENPRLLLSSPSQTSEIMLREYLDQKNDDGELSPF